MGEFMIYGANGYSGELCAREAVRQGMQPVLGGRNRSQVMALAGELGLECRVFGLEKSAAVDGGIDGMAAVLNCAGPFVRTAWPVIEACLRRGVHYVDISGEIDQFEGLAQRDAQAKTAGVMLLPGAGFAVVPSDCLAAHLKARLPSATRLVLGIAWQGRYSRGTASTAMENAHQGARIRRDGRIVDVPLGSMTCTLDFGRGPVKTSIMQWGDAATAYYSTGIPNVEVYFAFGPALQLANAAARVLAPVLRLRPVQAALVAAVRMGKPGPTAEESARLHMTLRGEASDEAGHRAAAIMRTGEGYQLTALSTVAIAKKVLAGQAPAGFQTPSLAYGEGLALELPGVELQDEAVL